MFFWIYQKWRRRFRDKYDKKWILKLIYAFAKWWNGVNSFKQRHKEKANRKKKGKPMEKFILHLMLLCYYRVVLTISTNTCFCPLQPQLYLYEYWLCWYRKTKYPLHISIFHFNTNLCTIKVIVSTEKLPFKNFTQIRWKQKTKYNCNK